VPTGKTLIVTRKEQAKMDIVVEETSELSEVT
jgi:hypothetical protein